MLYGGNSTVNKISIVMKKVLLSISLLLALSTSYSQNRKVVIDKCVNKSSVYGPTGVICSNLKRDKWFTLTPVYRLDGNRLSCDGFWSIRLNIGNLSKEDQLFFSFKDGSKLRLESEVELTSEKTIFFKITDLEFSILKYKEIETVRYINGNDFSSFQYKMVGDEERNYYTNLFNNYYIREVYCDK
jgi:hypothetical protein